MFTVRPKTFERICYLVKNIQRDTSRIAKHLKVFNAAMPRGTVNEGRTAPRFRWCFLSLSNLDN